MNNIKCLHPRIIVNPQLPQLLFKHRNYYFKGKKYYFASRNQFTSENFIWAKFSLRFNDISFEDVENCFVFSVSTGETFPIYFVVPCGKCDICRDKKSNSFVERCFLESQVYDCLPWFVTLTYDNKNLPTDGVSVRDCQLFLKRLRINLQRSGFSFRIRYFLCSEYGHLKGRPHYHLILWNINVKDIVNYKKVRGIIQSSWSKGFVCCRPVNLANDKAFYYTCKYMRKLSDVPIGSNKCFSLSSRRNGGIGAPYIDAISSELRSSMNTHFKIKDRFTGKIKDLHFSTYVLNRVFPSFCRSCCKEFRDCITDFSIYVKNLYGTVFYDNYRVTELYFRNVFPDVFQFNLSKSYLSKEYRLSPFECCNILDSCIITFNKLFDKIINKYKSFNFIRELDRKRRVFLSKLIPFGVEYDAKFLSFSVQVPTLTPYEVL